MKTNGWKYVAAVVAAVAGCGPGASHGVDRMEALHQAAGAVSHSPFQGTAELRLLGVNTANLRAAHLKIKAVEVRAKGKHLSGALESSRVDLCQTHQAWLLTTFEVPADTQEVEASVSFERDGEVEANDGVKAVDADCASITVTAPTSQLKLRGHAVLHLDVNRSMVQMGKRLKLVPQLSLHF